MNCLCLVKRLGWALVAGLLLVSWGTPVAAAPPPPQPPGEYQGPEYCGECHVDRYNLWSAGPHAHTYENPAFQDKWAEAGKDPECLACHMSGFDPLTEEYAQEAVTCEGCHGPLAMGHPESATMDVTRVEFLCDACHATSHHEWKESKHAQSDVTCNSCHFLCSLEVKAQNGNAVCVNCHEGYAEDEAHLSHAAQQFNCLDCHMHIDPSQETPDGLINTAHSFEADACACDRCHTGAPHSGDTARSLNQHTLKLGCAVCHTPPGVTPNDLTMRDIMAAPQAFACQDCHAPDGDKIDFAAMGYTDEEIKQLTWTDFPPITAEEASILQPDPQKGWGWPVWLGLAVGAFVIFEVGVARKLK